MVRAPLVFVVLDAAIALLVPAALVMRRWLGEGAGKRALVELTVFVSVMLLGLLYASRKGDLAS